ncbi:MAG: HD domain-containing protein [Nitrososphaerota archaeon]
MKATQESTSLAEFFQTAIKLKSVQRQGWKDKLGLQNPESVADHCYSMAVIAMVISDQRKLDTVKMIKMSLLHDLAETITGDLTPNQTSKSKKITLEDKAMKKILQSLTESQKAEYWNIWQEYQKNTSEEAKLLHQIDKLEMAIQASKYLQSGFTKNQLAPFFESAQAEIADKDLSKILSKFL